MEATPHPAFSSDINQSYSYLYELDSDLTVEVIGQGLCLCTHQSDLSFLTYIPAEESLQGVPLFRRQFGRHSKFTDEPAVNLTWLYLPV